MLTLFKLLCNIHSEMNDIEAQSKKYTQRRCCLNMCYISIILVMMVGYIALCTFLGIYSNEYDRICCSITDESYVSNIYSYRFQKCNSKIISNRIEQEIKDKYKLEIFREKLIRSVTIGCELRITDSNIHIIPHNQYQSILNLLIVFTIAFSFILVFTIAACSMLHV